MNKQITCIICPNGCELSVEWEKQSINNISGALCKRGEEYAAQEIQNPKRTITSLVKVTNGEIPLVSVRTTKAIPKENIFDVMEQIKKLEINAPVKIKQVIVKNILGLDSDIIATKFVEKKISNY